MTKHIELSHVIRDGLETYRGLPAPVICDFWSREAAAAHYADGVSFQIGRIDMVANTGTYVDVPFHRYEAGADLAGVGLEVLADLPGVCVTVADGRRAIDADVFAGVDVAGAAVMVHTDWSRHWGSESYFEGHPFLTAGAAASLRDRGARLVGIDSYNIDDTADLARPVHSILLAAGVPIVEHMANLAALPPAGFRFTAAPPRIEGMGSFPVRAFATVLRQAFTR